MNSKRNYPLLLGSQFLSAFGDNAILSVILGPLTFARAAGTITEAQVNSANALYSAVFFIPFILLAPLAGFLNDRFSKTRWLLGGNMIKLLGTLMALTGLLLDNEWFAISYLTIGIGACAYSPAKYGILPEILPAERLVKANGTVEMLTLVGILGGLGVGAALVDNLPLTTCLGIVGGIYTLSLALNLAMNKTPNNPSARLGNTMESFWNSLKELLTHPRLGKVLLGCGMFWFIGATMRTNLQSWGLEVLDDGTGEVTNTRLISMKLWLAVGIIIGSVLVGQFHRTGDLRKTRLYAMLIAIFIVPMAFINAGASFIMITLVLAVIGIFAGMFLIPLNASLQHESDHRTLGKTIAVQNFVDYLAMLIGAGFVMGCTRLHANLGTLSEKISSSHLVFLALAITMVLLTFLLRIPPLKPETTKA